MKHTSGPWSIGDIPKWFQDREISILDNENNTIADIYPVPAPSEQETNAHLIVAAPVMLEFLIEQVASIKAQKQEYLEILKDAADKDRANKELNKEIERFQHIIDLATGENNPHRD